MNKSYSDFNKANKIRLSMPQVNLSKTKINPEPQRNSLNSTSNTSISKNHNPRYLSETRKDTISTYTPSKINIKTSEQPPKSLSNSMVSRNPQNSIEVTKKSSISNYSNQSEIPFKNSTINGYKPKPNLGNEKSSSQLLENKYIKVEEVQKSSSKPQANFGHNISSSQLSESKNKEFQINTNKPQESFRHNKSSSQLLESKNKEVQLSNNKLQESFRHNKSSSQLLESKNKEVQISGNKLQESFRHNKSSLQILETKNIKKEEVQISSFKPNESFRQNRSSSQLLENKSTKLEEVQKSSVKPQANLGHNISSSQLSESKNKEFQINTNKPQESFRHNKSSSQLLESKNKEVQLSNNKFQESFRHNNSSSQLLGSKNTKNEEAQINNYNPQVKLEEKKSNSRVFDSNYAKVEEVKQVKQTHQVKNYKKCYCCLNDLIEKEYLSPKCKQHVYCLICIKGGFVKYKRLDCTHCENFFNSIKKEPIKNELKCSLCIKCPNRKYIRCQIHDFCEDCFNFLLSNEFNYIEKIYSCQDCKNSFKRIKHHQNRNKDKSNNINPDIFTPRTSEFLGDSTKRTILSISFPDPKSKQDCFNPHSSRNHDKNLLKIIPQNNSIQKTPQITKQNLENIKIIQKKTEKTESFILSYRGLNECIQCVICGYKKNIKAFLCNHNTCIYCLVGNCCKEIFNFFLQYQINQQVALKPFSYKCPVNECGKDISVPTMIVLKNLAKFLDDQESFERFRSFEFLKDMGQMKIWIPYFDGIPYFLCFSN